MRGARPSALLLASEGRAYPAATIERAASLARSIDADIRVLSIARIWGSGFGFPNPWLMPSRRELEQQRSRVADAVARLRASGIAAEGRVVGTRDAAGRILAEARAIGAEALVMAADPPPRSRLLGELFWAHEPYRVQRRARVPVHLVVG